ncbi:MAG: DUF4279 domain-containing protein [Hormoscilla sp. GM7CHS1pb]|nr:DUF4279 domain-containing protein [Hormoscilla sp. GM7CHS1pb]
MESEILASFTLTGEFDPEEITNKVGIIPSETWRMGELIHPKGTIRHQQNGWSLKSKLEKSAELEDHVKYVLEQLQPGWIPLAELCTQHDAEIDCVIYVNGQVTAIHFDKRIIDLVNKLNAEIDVDLYVISGE